MPAVLTAEALAASFAEASGATEEAVQALAYTLCHTVGADEKALVEGLRGSSVVEAAVTHARTAGPGAELTAVLGALINLACRGGQGVVAQQGSSWTRV